MKKGAREFQLTGTIRLRYKELCRAKLTLTGALCDILLIDEEISWDAENRPFALQCVLDETAGTD